MPYDAPQWKPGFLGIQFDREKLWSRGYASDAWSLLKAQGVDFVRGTHYLWSPESTGLYDAYKTSVNFCEWKVVSVRRSTNVSTPERIVLQLDGGSYIHKAGEVIRLNQPISYDGYTLPANTDITLTIDSSVNDVIIINTGSARADLGVLSVTAGTWMLHRNFWRQGTSIARYPFGTMVGQVDAMLAAGLAFYWGGQHSNLRDRVVRWGESIVHEIENAGYAYLAAKAWPASKVAFSTENEPVWLYTDNNPTEQAQRWLDYLPFVRTQHAALRALMPDHTLIYGYPAYNAAYGLRDFAHPLSGDRNTMATAHFYPSNQGSWNFGLTVESEYQTVISRINEQQLRHGVRVIIGEHGWILADVVLKAQRLGWAAKAARQKGIPICFWAFDESGYSLGALANSGTGWRATVSQQIIDAVRVPTKTGKAMTKVSGGKVLFFEGRPVSV